MIQVYLELLWEGDTAKLKQLCGEYSYLEHEVYSVGVQ